MLILIDKDIIADIKRALRAILPHVRSAYLSEALARGLGHATNSVMHARIPVAGQPRHAAFVDDRVFLDFLSSRDSSIAASPHLPSVCSEDIDARSSHRPLMQAVLMAAMRHNWHVAHAESPSEALMLYVANQSYGMHDENELLPSSTLLPFRVRGILMPYESLDGELTEDGRPVGCWGRDHFTEEMSELLDEGYGFPPCPEIPFHLRLREVVPPQPTTEVFRHRPVLGEWEGGTPLRIAMTSRAHAVSVLMWPSLAVVTRFHGERVFAPICRSWRRGGMETAVQAWSEPYVGAAERMRRVCEAIGLDVPIMSWLPRDESCQ